MHFQLNCEIKMHQKIDDEIFEPERNFFDVFSNFTYELSFLLYNVLIYCLRRQKRVKNASYFYFHFLLRLRNYNAAKFVFLPEPRN